MADLPHIDALGVSGSYRSVRQVPVADVAGTAVAELSLVPDLYARRNIAALRKAEPVPAAQRSKALAAAGHLFATGEVGGFSLKEYEHAVCRVTGVPISVVRAATRSTAQNAASVDVAVHAARPRRAVSDWRTRESGLQSVVWVRRGNVLAVHAAGNHPATHSVWLEALALGYRVAVRPSVRDPFTPHRLVTALRECGLGDDQVILLPTDHAVADHVIQLADLSLVYGDVDVAAKYAGAANVLVQGPGRSKILLHDEWRSHVDMVVDSVSGFGATACVNAKAVFVEGDPTPAAEVIATRLSAIPTLAPECDAAVLPAFPLARASAIEGYLRSEVRGSRLLSEPTLVDRLPDGGAVLRPAVIVLDHPDPRRAAIELPFPCVWVARWSPQDGIEPLRDSLVVTAITTDTALLDQLVTDPSIRNVHIGDHPTHLMDQSLPHDGYLAEFLMRSKTVIGP